MLQKRRSEKGILCPRDTANGINRRTYCPSCGVKAELELGRLISALQYVSCTGILDARWCALRGTYYSIADRTFIKSSVGTTWTFTLWIYTIGFRFLLVYVATLRNRTTIPMYDSTRIYNTLFNILSCDLLHDGVALCCVLVQTSIQLCRMASMSLVF